MRSGGDTGCLGSPGAKGCVRIKKGAEITHLFLIIDHLLGHIFSEGGHSEIRQ